MKFKYYDRDNDTQYTDIKSNDLINSVQGFCNLLSISRINQLEFPKPFVVSRSCFLSFL